MATLRSLGVGSPQPFRAQLRSRFYCALEMSPSLYCRYQGRFDDRHPPDARTDIVVEGYPSAGNSFTRESLILCNPGLRVASHLHSVAPVRLAARLGLPAVVLVREPVASVASYLARFDRGTPAGELARYTRFLRGLDRVGDYPLVVRYEWVTADFAGVIDTVNRWFHRQFRAYDGTQDELTAKVDENLLATSRQVFGDEALLRGAIRGAVRRPVIEEISDRLRQPQYRSPLSVAERAYQSILDSADRVAAKR